MNALTLHYEDLRGQPSFQAINKSLRALVALAVNTDPAIVERSFFTRIRRPATQAFVPSPLPTSDSKGRAMEVGVLGLTKDGKIRFVNPKDSADQWAVQTFDPANGVLILPGADEPSVATINDVVKSVTADRTAIRLDTFDALLKALHRTYATCLKQVPDIYCDTTRQLDASRHVDLGRGLYQKVAVPETMFLVRVPEGATVAFYGTAQQDGGLEGAQYANRDFVVTTGTKKDVGDYALKLDMDYARANLVQPDGRQIDWAAVPSFRLVVPVIH